ncbi:MAG: GNAT family N-acetyltransferase [Acidimicrobiia bacterium]|nr:GNAT family N-acetyltransferase [Acidimicrobiia bacterium]
MGVPVLRTERLLLRAWRDDDLAPFAELNGDPEVMEHFPYVLTPEQSDDLARRIGEEFARRGFGLWAVEVPGASAFIGFVGLAVPGFQAVFTPCVEVGWRLARHSWGHGYASEAAVEVLRFAFEDLMLDEVVSFTATTNLRSQAVMRRIGMTHDPADDFDHPRMPEGHVLRRHVLYRARSSRP